jgi:hypothetical protein
MKCANCGEPTITNDKTAVMVARFNADRAAIILCPTCFLKSLEAGHGRVIHVYGIPDALERLA